MRILQIHTSYRQRGGEDTVVANERRLLQQAGHEVRLHLEQNPSGAVHTAGTMLLSPWNPRAIGRAMNVVSQFEPDVVHIHNTWFTLSPGIFPALRAAGMAVVATIHNYRLMCVNAMFYRDGSPCEDCLGRLPWRGVVRRCYRDSVIQSGVLAAGITIHRARRTWANDVDVLVALTQFGANRLIASGVPEDRIVVKPNVVADRGERTMGAERSNKVLFVGRLSEEKGIADLIAAWSRVAPSSLSLEVVGDGPLAGVLEPAPGVTMHGPLSPQQVGDMMGDARALVVPSRWFEGQPMVVLEGLSASIPVVVPDLGALPEIVGGGGIIFRPGDFTHLSEAVASLEDDDLVSVKSKAAREMYLSHYHPTKGIAELEEVYGLAIDRSGRLPH